MNIQGLQALLELAESKPIMAIRISHNVTIDRVDVEYLKPYLHSGNSNIREVVRELLIVGQCELSSDEQNFLHSNFVAK